METNIKGKYYTKYKNCSTPKHGYSIIEKLILIIKVCYFISITFKHLRFKVTLSINFIKYYLPLVFYTKNQRFYTSKIIDLSYILLIRIIYAVIIIIRFKGIYQDFLNEHVILSHKETTF